LRLNFRTGGVRPQPSAKLLLQCSTWCIYTKLYIVHNTKIQNLGYSSVYKTVYSTQETIQYIVLCAVQYTVQCSIQSKIQNSMQYRAQWVCGGEYVGVYMCGVCACVGLGNGSGQWACRACGCVGVWM